MFEYLRGPVMAAARGRTASGGARRPAAVPPIAADGWICGVDEAGRGPLAGPVVAAAVILDPAHPIAGLDDSKALSAKKREALFEQIHRHALAFCIASASVEEIDTLNILQATMLAMQRAVAGLTPQPALAQIDGNRCPPLAMTAQAIVGGDALVPSISAASILAKVTRDRMLLALHQIHPEYGFDVHAGYGTARHMQALAQHGPCAQHRRSFAPVREACAARGAAGLPVPTAASGAGAVLGHRGAAVLGDAQATLF
jgi:ribonuclease HII